MSVELLLSRLDDPRPNGRDRWRCACPVCGGTNRSTLSVGVGDIDGVVLVRCWKSGCSPEEIAQALGLELSDLFPPRESSGSPMKRRRVLSAGQALSLLDGEATLIVLCASDMARGEQLDDETRERLLQGAARVSMMREEVRS